MANFVFNIAKGRVAELAALPGANDAFIVVPIETSGIVSDATMIDYDTLDALLAGASNEQTTMGRKTLTGVAASTNDANDRKEVDADDVSWVAATGNAISKVLICYDADTTSGTDADVVPLLALDLVVAPSGGDITLVFASGGFYQAS
jgi:hypothetical protein